MAAEKEALIVEVARLTPRLRADVLLVPTPTPKGRPVLRSVEGVDAETARRLTELIAAWRGGKEAGTIDDHIGRAGAAFRRIAIVSLGKDLKVKRESVRAASAAAAQWCARHRLVRAVAVIGPMLRFAGQDAATVWAEAAILSGFRYDKLRSMKRDDEPPKRLKLLTLAGAEAPTPAMKAAVVEAAMLAESVNLARRYSHEPPNVINPVSLATAVQAEAWRAGLRCQVLDENRLATLKMNAMLAVGRGSATPPRLIILEHAGRTRGAVPVILVGKAVTLDTGGYSIKPHESIPDMKYDKCGGMAVLGAMVAAARLELPIRVVGIIVAAENMIAADAYRPGDILTAASGKTIEVISTDAEGRLMLADALHYAQKAYKPRAIIDVATLTGACVVALGHHAAGLFSNRDDLAAALAAAGDRTGERLWRMPLWPEYRKQIEGTDSDLKNSGGRPGGAITAAMFLNEFVGDSVPWAHLDIAGVAHIDKDTPICPKGATGFGVRLLIEFLRGLA